MKSYLVHIFAAVFFLSLFSAFAEDNRLGANSAATPVAAFLKTLSLQQGKINNCSVQDTEKLIALAAKLHINVFELLDCIFRYIDPLNIRISLSGTALRNLQTNYDLGGERVLAILPVDKLTSLETGAILSPEQSNLDIYLNAVHETFIEIGTAYYEIHCGFRKMSPLEFSQPFGISIKKLFLRTPLEKLELYAPGKGAIYVKGLSHPKRWNLDVITVKNK